METGFTQEVAFLSIESVLLQQIVVVDTYQILNKNSSEFFIKRIYGIINFVILLGQSTHVKVFGIVVKSAKQRFYKVD